MLSNIYQTIKQLQVTDNSSTENPERIDDIKTRDICLHIYNYAAPSELLVQGRNRNIKKAFSCQTNGGVFW